MLTLASSFHAEGALEETRMQLALLRHCESHLRSVFCDGEQAARLDRLLAASPCCSVDDDKALTGVAGDVRAVLSEYNIKHRLCIKDRSSWPRQELVDLAREVFSPYGFLTCPTPCEFVDPSYAWWGWGTHEDRRADWIGHGWFWKARPEQAGLKEEKIENMAGSSLNDFDVLEAGFGRLKKASVITADYELLRRDFPLELSGMDDSEVDAWLVRNAAFLSEGQVSRLAPGGDHHTLLGLDVADGGLDAFIDTSVRRSGIRQKSGGRAVTLIAQPEAVAGEAGSGESTSCTYSFCGEPPKSFLVAPMLDVKGVGTHADADFAASASCTGLLNYSDALRELGLQRLVQRLADIDGTDWGTCQTYAILDTGLAYGVDQTNPATGWNGEKCVLTVRQRQSRCLVDYRGYNFRYLVSLFLSALPSSTHTRM